MAWQPVLAIILMLSSTPAEAELVYTEQLPVDDYVVIDVRPEETCQQATLENAVCIAPEAVTTPARRLANFSGLLWLLGTAALDGSESVVIVGRDASRKEFMAGLLHLAGQARVEVLIPSIDTLLDVAEASSKGRVRSNVRLKVFKSPMRSDYLVLRNQLVDLMSSDESYTLLDGRSEPEYWGHLIHAIRGGHIPGAQYSPLASWTIPAQALKPQPYTGQVIAYGHDSMRSIAYYARLTGHGIAAKVLHEGWAGWAIDGQLPIDAASYPAQQSGVLSPEADHRDAQQVHGVNKLRLPILVALLIMVSLLSGLAGGYWLNKRGVNAS